MKFVHLHAHTHYSLLDGLPQVKPSVQQAKELGMNSLAITDHGVMYGVVEFYKVCKAVGINPIIGVEAYIAKNKLTDKRPKIDNKSYHLVLLAKNYQGYKNLMKLTSIAHQKGFYYKPRVDLDMLREFSEGIICLSACLNGEIAKTILYGRPEEAVAKIDEYYKIFGEGNFFLEIQPHERLREQVAVNQQLIKYAKEMGIPLVATNDIHYLRKEDKDAQDVLTCISTGKIVSEPNRMKMDEVDCYMKTPQEMFDYFKEVPEAISNTQMIADQCDLEIPLGKFYFPNIELPKEKTADEVLREDVFFGCAERYKIDGIDKLNLTEVEKKLDEEYPEVKKRLEYELNIIITKGYSAYFLITADFAIWASKKGIITTTRGSAAGSLVSYSLGIIQINPLDYKLPFERFLNPFRDSAPDIDTDIEESRRHEVIEYVIEKYGKDHVAQIITFGSMLARAAVRDVGRALGMEYAIPDRISKMIPLGSQGFAMTIERAKEESPELLEAYKKEEDTRQILDLAQRLEGCARHSSIHAAGVVISPTPLTDFCPLQSDNEGSGSVTQYEMHAIEDVGLVKMDFLGLRNLSMIGKALDIIKNTKGHEIDIYKIPLDDKKTYEMLSQGLTYGVFQLSGGGMTKHLMDLKPERIHDIMAMVALYRPGPMNSIPEYIQRKRNPSLVKFIDPRLKEILEISYGIITYQDDVLLIAINLAGYTWGEADKLRKAMGKKIPEEMAKQKEKLLKGFVEHGMTLQIAEELFKLIEPFAAYGFNKAHACSYGTVAYQTGYLKANYTAEYMAAYLTCESGDSDKVADAIKECKKMGISVLPPDVNESLSDFTVVNDKTIRFGLLAIKNIGEGIVNAIIEEREAGGVFKTLDDFVVRIRDKSFNKKNLEALAKSGSLDRFSERTQLIANTESILSYARDQHKAFAAGQESLFGGGNNDSTRLGLKLMTVEPESQKVQLMWEKELLGVFLSEHPFSAVEKKVRDVIIPLRDLKKYKDGDKLYIAGIVSQIKQITTKKGDLMMFANISDLDTSVEMIVFPRTFRTQRKYLEVDRIILIEGNVSDKDGENKMIVDKVYNLDTDDIQGVLNHLKLREDNSPLNRAIKPQNIARPAMVESPTPSDQMAPEINQHLVLKIKYPISMPLTQKLKTLFSLNQGDLKVYLNVFTNSDSKMIETHYLVNLNRDLLKELKCCEGVEAIQVR